MTQAEALNILKSGFNVFLTGEPGSGKTFVINQYVQYLRRAKVEVAVTASTGIAATHLGGMTIHSWSGIGISKFLSDWDLDRITTNQRVYKRIWQTKVLVIDEISMLDARVLENVNKVCHEIKKNDQPFGGLQIIFVGDFFQLPPIEESSEFAFVSSAWTNANPVVCYLSEQHRQEDKEFLGILLSMRRNSVTETHCTILKKRCFNNAELSLNITKLFSHNEDVDRLNLSELARLPDKEKIFLMTYAGRKTLIEQLKRGCLSPEQLILKEGAVVMFTKNNMKDSFVNGTLGKVMGFDEDSGHPVVETTGGREIIVEPMDWTIEEQGKVLAKITQLPLRLAWAITVHKSQGMSLDAAFIDLRKAFVEGQGYVALSRVRTLSGLYLLGWNDMALKVHPGALLCDQELHTQSDYAKEEFGKLSPEAWTKMHYEFIEKCGGKIVKERKRVKSSALGKAYSVEKIREKYPNAYKSWSGEEDQILKKYFQEGRKVKEIANLLGRKLGAIYSRLGKLLLLNK